MFHTLTISRLAIGCLRHFIVLAILYAAAMGQVYSSGGPVVNNVGQPVFAQIAVCTTSPPGMNPPDCSVRAATYTDATLTTPCNIVPTTLGPISGAGCTNPGNTDSRGNYTVFAPSAVYYSEFYGYGITTYLMPISTATSAGNFASPPPLGNVTPNIVNSTGGALNGTFNGTVGGVTPGAGTFTNLVSNTSSKFSFITGATQCLHADTTGLITGTGGDCGVAGGGNFSGPGSSITNNIVSFNDASGHVGKDSGVSAINPSFSGTLGVAGNTTLTNATLSGTLGVTGLSSLGTTTITSGATNGNAFTIFGNSLTTGNGVLSQSNNITSGVLLYGFHNTSAYAGVGLQLALANGSGSFTGQFARFLNNGSLKFNVDSNGNTIQAGSSTLASNPSGYVFTDANSGSPQLIMQGDNNLVFYGTNASGALQAIWNSAMHTNSPIFSVNVATLLNNTLSVVGNTTLSGTVSVPATANASDTFGSDPGISTLIVPWPDSAFRFGRTDGTVGVSTYGLFSGILASNSAMTSNYQRAGIFGWCRHNDTLSTSPNHDCIGVQGYGDITSGNTNAKVWGSDSVVSVPSGTDGTAYGSEIDVLNAGSANTTLNSTNSKQGLLIANIGSVKSTVAINIANTGTGGWQYGVNVSGTASGGYPFNYQNTGGATTCSVTGAGGGATCGINTGGHDLWGIMIVTAGTTPTAAGTVSLTFAQALGAHQPSCQVWLENGTGAFNARATAIGSGLTTTGFSAIWDNNSVNLINGSSYWFTYHCEAL